MIGLGLTQYIPFYIYYSSLVAAVLSFFYNPKIGIYLLFPLLPYQVIFEKIKLLPLGKDLNDIVLISILIGWFLRTGKNKEEQTKKDSSPAINIGVAVAIFVAVNFTGLALTSFKTGFSLDSANSFLVDWKNYMVLPFLWFLTFKVLRNRRDLQILVFLMTIGILGASYYFYNNLKWMNIWHFSEKARNMMSGLFVYLGPNHYGAFFVHFIFVLIGIFLFEKSRIRRIVLLCIISLTGYCLVYTFSRAAYLAFLAGLAFIGIVKEKKILILLFIFILAWRSLVPISVAERVDMLKNDYGELEESSAKRV